MIIKDLKEKHPFIYYTAMLRYDQLRGGHGSGSEVFSFEWSRTREGVNVWGHVSRKNYMPFYLYHGRNPETGCLDKIT